MKPENSSLRWRRFLVAFATTAFLFYSQSAGAPLDVSVDPEDLTSADTFALRAFHEFGSCCMTRLDQSITFDVNQIDVYVLMEPPFDIVLPVVTPHGAYFTGLGPLDPGTYHVDAEMWMRQPRFGGYQDVLFSTGSLTFNVGEPQAGAVLEGDYNRDGQVDAADYIVWRSSLGSSDILAADGDRSGTVDEPDYGVWRSHFGRTLESSSAVSTVVNGVPEPVAFAAVAAAVFFLLYMRTPNHQWIV
jgi:hypothetical protein